jgi:kynurenine formamidase
MAGVEPRLGDAILIRSGWAAKWGDPAAYQGAETGMPGVNASGAELIAEWEARLTGHDSYAYEQVRPPADGPRVVAVHRILLVGHGIHILENLNLEHLAEDRVYEFLLVVTPLNIVGATGSPVRPIAVVFQ